MRERQERYNLGDNEFHLAFRVDDFQAAHKKHQEMGCICYENKKMGDFLEKLGLTPDEITSYVINGSEEDINNMITRVKGL